MNIEHIKTFLAVYRTGSFIDVAKEHNVAPSSISRSIATLENILTTRLFQRTTRNLTPTQAGEAYFEKMLPLIEEMDLVHDSLIDTIANPSGCLRITASVSYGQIIIAPQLKNFRMRYPNIELELILSDSRIDIISEQIDIAIRHGELQDSNLIARKLCEVKYRLVSNPSYLEKHGAPANPEDINKYDIITFSYENFRRQWKFMNKAKKISKNILIKPALIITNAAAIRQCAYNGTGIALLPDWAVEKDLASGKLIELLPKWNISGSSAITAIWLVYPSNRFFPAKTRVFTDFFIGNKTI